MNDELLTYDAAWLYLLGIVYCDARGIADKLSPEHPHLHLTPEELRFLSRAPGAICRSCPACAAVSALMATPSNDLVAQSRAVKAAFEGARAPLTDICEAARATFELVRHAAALPGPEICGGHPSRPWLITSAPRQDPQRAAYRQTLLSLPTVELLRLFREHDELLLDGLADLLCEEGDRVATDRCDRCGGQQEPMPSISDVLDVILLLLVRLYVGEPDRAERRLLMKELGKTRSLRKQPDLH